MRAPLLGLRLALPLVAACGRGEEDRRFDASDDPSCGSWETVGLPVLLDACAACHAAGLEGAARHGAPVGLDLDSLAGLRASASAVEAAVSAGTMPPGGGLSEADASRLLAWLQCGAPGEEAVLPSFEAPAGQLGAAETRISVVSDADGLLLLTELSGGDLDGRVGPWSEERYLVEPHRAQLQARVRYDADGAELLRETWDPPLLILDADAEQWTTDSVLTREGPGLWDVVEQRWELSREAAESADPRQPDPEAETLDLRLSDRLDGPGTLSMSWRLSETLSLVQREIERQDEDGSLVSESHMQLTVAWPFEDLPDFPLSEEVEWMGRMLLAEGEAP